MDSDRKSRSCPDRFCSLLQSGCHRIRRDKRVMAQTGISLENIQEVRDLGFGGAVVCSDLWKRFNIHSGMDFKDVIKHFHKLRKASE